MYRMDCVAVGEVAVRRASRRYPKQNIPSAEYFAGLIKGPPCSVPVNTSRSCNTWLTGLERRIISAKTDFQDHGRLSTLA